MGQTLRRSCAACAKAKHSCDLRTPHCSRCVKRKVRCVYANAPSTVPSTASTRAECQLLGRSPDNLGSFGDGRLASLDPFESYPQTRLPRDRVQRLIHSFIHKIAFQYYPLDVNAASNPFLVSWWPLALGDPALFHVSLQTACLDEELLAQKGFEASEILMADSVTLLRRKIENLSLAVQDGTMNSVITLAAIEFGKGNTETSDMHVEGVKRLVHLRGGINSVRQTSPLTARMVAWVSMLVTGHPQFETQDDFGIGDGIPPTHEWQMNSIISLQNNMADLHRVGVGPEVRNVYNRLRNAFHRAQRTPLPSTQLHDLASFVIHRLLLTAPNPASPAPSPITECLRYAMVLFMFIVQGPTYFSHAVILNNIVARFIENFTQLEWTLCVFDPLDVWFFGVGLAASSGTAKYSWFVKRAQAIIASLQLNSWDEVLEVMKSVLWLETLRGESIFRRQWETVFNVAGGGGVVDTTSVVWDGMSLE